MNAGVMKFMGSGVGFAAEKDESGDDTGGEHGEEESPAAHGQLQRTADAVSAGAAVGEPRSENDNDPAGKGGSHALHGRWPEPLAPHVRDGFQFETPAQERTEHRPQKGAGNKQRAIVPRRHGFLRPVGIGGDGIGSECRDGAGS